MRRAPGFSLIELVVVILIAAILAALAIPRFTAKETDAVWFGEQVKAALRYAQREAVAQRRCVFVSVTSTQLSLLYGDGGCAITTTPVKQFSPGDDYVLTAPAGVGFSGAPYSFYFNGLGRPSTGLTVSAGGVSVTVEAETGYVR